MPQNKPDIADLLADESFINYCKKSSHEDIVRWENYIKENPGHRDQIAAAQDQFLILFNALAFQDLAEQTERLKNRLALKTVAPVISIQEHNNAGEMNKKFSFRRIATIVAVSLVTVFLAMWFFKVQKTSVNRSYTAAYGERKNVQLPDGSMVNLNAGSKIEIAGSFGVSDRNVKLEGEAFFDVRHNKSLPFVVQTRAINVKALGTAFDVKAYDDENITEASLIRGMVEVTLKENSNRTLILRPNEKIVWKLPGAAAANEKNSVIAVDVAATNDHVPVTVTTNGEIKEIAWKENRLVFENDLLSDIATQLARWYGVTIKFNDDSIRNYRYTAVFEKEDLRTVLGLLKESREFDFIMENTHNKTILLSK